MYERTIILHYHLFKNAGTSVDRILKHNFPNQWVTREFPGTNNSDLVAEWIQSEKDAVAFSSHTMMGPIPKIDGVRVFSLLFLRDPIARIISAYKFERTQTIDTAGARLAKDHDLEGYVRTRLATPGDRQCRDFQTYRLAALRPGPEKEIDRALAAMAFISFIGTVEEFNQSMERLEHVLRPDFHHFSNISVKANASETSVPVISKSLREILEASNRQDKILIESLNSLNTTILNWAPRK